MNCPDCQQTMLDFLRSASWLQVGGFFLVVNLIIFGCSIAMCLCLAAVFSRKRIFDRWEPVRRVEVAAALGAVTLNAVVSVIGWWLWQRGWIELRNPGIFRSVFDTLLMILAMDLGMYIVHRAAHIPLLYRLIHRFHHRHEATNPISLFVLHPVEVFGFGGLMIAFLVIYPMSLPGLMAYLALNVLFGTLGHCGVEPFPAQWKSIPLLRWVGTSTFHAEHHEHPGYNFGFYTLLWDRIFGTLDPDYERRFEQRG